VEQRQRLTPFERLVNDLKSIEEWPEDKIPELLCGELSHPLFSRGLINISRERIAGDRVGCAKKLLESQRKLTSEQRELLSQFDLKKLGKKVDILYGKALLMHMRGEPGAHPYFVYRPRNELLNLRRKKKVTLEEIGITDAELKEIWRDRLIRYANANLPEIRRYKERRDGKLKYLYHSDLRPAKIEITNPRLKFTQDEIDVLKEFQRMGKFM
jgi:hypothetical protein